ncbi:MAG: ABC transporter permease [Pseudomonadota bacterium]
MSAATVYLLEWRYEFIRLLRSPGFAIPSLTFPAAFYVLFALVMSVGGGSRGGMATYLLASYGVFGVMGPGLFGFGVGVAIERSQGLMLLKFASPMPHSAYFLSKVLMSVTFSALIVASLFTLATVFGGVKLEVGQGMLLAGILLLGAVPFCALGLAIGSWVDGQAAAPIVNLIYLPMAALSGLWFPLRVMPESLQTLAWALPPFHLNQLATKTIGMDDGHSIYIHIGALVIYTAAFLWIAAAGLRREKALSTAQAT